MTYRFLDPDIRVALDQIANYADRCWTVYDHHQKGKLTLEHAVSRITELYYEAHNSYSLLRTIRPPLKEARRDLWTCGLIHQRIHNLRQKHSMETRRDRPPERKAAD